MNKNIYSIWLNMKESLFARRAAELIDYFGDAKAVYDADKIAYKESGVVTKHSDIQALMNKNLTPAVNEYEKALECGVEFIDCASEFYPERLKQIPARPILFYAKGNINLLKQQAMFAMVGARKATVYGKNAARDIARELTLAGMTIVSGTALGVDSASHEGALIACGKSIAVAACGLDVDYPKGNEELRRRLIEKNLIISEYPFGTQPHSFNFPIRNRILSGMSLGVAIIEAQKHKSGSLITAGYATEQGRDVFALPGDINRPFSKGTNDLIKNGAILLNGAEDILEEYLQRYPEMFLNKQDVEEFYQRKEPKQPPVITESCVEYIQNGEEGQNEQLILSNIQHEPVHIDTLCRISGLDTAKVNAIITILQIKGKIKELPGKNYVRN